MEQLRNFGSSPSDDVSEIAVLLSPTEDRRCHRLEAELRFCRSAILFVNERAKKGSCLEAYRGTWIIEDVADQITASLSDIRDTERRERVSRWLTQVHNDVDTLRERIGPLPVSIEPSGILADQPIGRG